MKMSLKAARVNAGLSQAQAAEKIGVHQNTICRWETGASVPSVRDVQAICSAYGVTYDQIDFERTA